MKQVVKNRKKKFFLVVTVSGGIPYFHWMLLTENVSADTIEDRIMLKEWFVFIFLEFGKVCQYEPMLSKTFATA